MVAGATVATVSAVVTGGAAVPAIAAAPVIWFNIFSPVIIVGGPAAAAVVGTDGLNWDCWRNVLRDYETPGNGEVTLRDLAAHPRIKSARVEEKEGFWPQYWLTNQWDETFRIDYVSLPEGEIAAHATMV